MRSLLLWWVLSVHVWFYVVSEEDGIVSKRYVAALAKNGRLPKFSFAQKKNSESEEGSLEEGNKLPLQQSVKEDNIYLSDTPGTLRVFESTGNIPLDSYDSFYNQYMSKRNVAALARLGRLNTIRYGRFQPHYVSGKRVSNEEENDVVNDDSLRNEIDDSDILCEDIESDGRDDIIINRNGKQKKRYVAALARSGRLPIWHSQRMWGGGKRDYAIPLWIENSRLDVNNDLDNIISGMPYYSQKLKRCRHISGYKRQKRSTYSEDDNKNIQNDNSIIPDYSYENNKNNEKVLQDDKSKEEIPDGPHLPENFSEGSADFDAVQTKGDLLLNYNIDEKRNIASLARNGKLLRGNIDDKRNVAALAKNGKLPSFTYTEGKRNMAALAKNGKLPAFTYTEGKRNLAALARNGKLPSFTDTEGKRNLAALAKNGKLPSFTYSEGKRNLAALARNGKLPSFTYNEGKRNLAALAKNGKLPSFTYSEGKRNLAALARNGKLPSFTYTEGKRNLAALAKNGKLPSFTFSEGKRNLAALARNGKLPSFLQEDKRNLAALARDGKLPFLNNGKRNVQALARKGNLPHSADDKDDITLENEKENSSLFQLDNKRNVAVLAKNNKLPSFHYVDDKRDTESTQSDNSLILQSPDEKRNLASLARNSKLPSFYRLSNKRNLESDSEDQKRNIAALARNGKLQSFNRADKKIDIDMESYTIDKRNVAALARNGKFPSFSSMEGKRNMAALARNSKLPSFYYSTGKRNLAALARNGKLPSFYNNKRNSEEFVGNKELLPYSDMDETQENLSMLEVNAPEDKSSLGDLDDKSQLLKFSNEEGKRNIAALVRNGKLRGYQRNTIKKSKLPQEEWEDMMFHSNIK